MHKTLVLQPVSTAKEIEQCPLNTSRSKHLFSFSKSQRFSARPPACHQIYNLPSLFLPAKSKAKGAALGYGNKLNWTLDRSCSPAATKYHLDSLFDKNQSKHKGYTLAASRTQIPSRGHVPLGPLQSPSPQKYSPKHPKLTHSPAYTMRANTKIIDRTMSVLPQNDNPEPGRYSNPEELSPKGIYPVTKHKNPFMIPFSRRSSSRFDPVETITPGPGKYLTIDLNQSLSTHFAQGKRAFDKEHREMLMQRNARKDYRPGPGSYRYPSDFGHYDGEVYARNKQAKAQAADKIE